MRKTLAALIVVSVLLSGSARLYAQEAAAAGKFAFIDLSRAFDSYAKTEQYDQNLEKKRQAKQDEREKKVKEIKKLQDKLALLNAKEKEKTQADIETQLHALNEFDQLASMDLRKERDDFLKEILKEIQDAITEFAAKENYTFIFNDRVLLYANPALDITDQLIAIMNDKLSKKK